MWNKRMGWVAALLLLAVETPVLMHIALLRPPDGKRARRPFAIKVLEPVIVSEMPSGRDLFWSDRILEIDGRPVLSRSDFEEAMQAAETRGTANVLVEHYPEDSEPWQQMAVAEFRSGGAAISWEHLADTAWFSGVIWPAVCVLLGASVLAVNGGSRRAWLAALLLAGAGHFSWSIVTPYSWPEPWRSFLLIYDSLITAAGPIALFTAAMTWPAASREGWDRWLWRIGVAWVVANIAVNWAAKTSYALLQPIAWLDPVWRSTFLLVVIAGVTTAIRWSGAPAQGLPPSQRAIAVTLRRGVWCFQLSLGFLLIFLPQLLEMDAVLQLQPLVWICYAACLGFPLAVAWVGSQRDEETIALAPLQPASDWADLFTQARQAAQQQIGVQMLAMYGPAEGEVRVRAAVPGAAKWPPVTGNEPPTSRVLHWEPFSQGYLAVAATDFEDRQREALRRLAQQVGEQAARLATTPDTAG